MAPPNFDPYNFPTEITADPLALTHNEAIFEMLTEAIKDDRFIAAQAHAGYLYERKDYLEFAPLASDQRGYLQGEDRIIQFSIRIGKHDAAELGLIDLERTILAENDLAEAERLEGEAARLQAAAQAAQKAADDAAEKAVKARNRRA